MAKNHNGMRPQDVVILLKKITPQGKAMLNKEIASSLGISASEVSESLERSRVAKLVDQSKQSVHTLALREFIIHGLKYAFPAPLGSTVRGIPTAASASPIKEELTSSADMIVWPYCKGTARGMAIEPLYKSVPIAVQNDNELYQLLTIADTFRIGRAREIDIATTKLDQYLRL